MAYTSLKTDGAPQSIKDFVKQHVDMQMHDVHTMLRLPLAEESGMEGGCSFASVSVLCALIAGASTVFFRRHGPDGERFTDLLAAHYPWDSQPRGGVEPSVAISAIYGRYRNPLVHALALSTRKSGRGAARRIVVDTREKPLGVIKQALTEEAVVVLEQSDGPAPSWLTPVVTSNSADGVDLYPHSLYWGTRRMFESLFRDGALMQQTVDWFAPLADGTPSRSQPG
jgi:hypothetical protein